jgi:hypothetical protein
VPALSRSIYCLLYSVPISLITQQVAHRRIDLVLVGVSPSSTAPTCVPESPPKHYYSAIAPDSIHQNWRQVRVGDAIRQLQNHRVMGLGSTVVAGMWYVCANVAVTRTNRCGLNVKGVESISRE